MTAEPTAVYTDGACSGNPGPGGWAWAVPDGAFAAGCEARSTNQRMEVHAVLDALRSLDGPLEVVSDSTYVVNCFRDRWWEGWRARGWKNSQKKDVANQDLWRPLIDAYLADPTRVSFRWVKGHSGDRMNDLVDRLAVEAATTQRPRSGAEPPGVLGPADAVPRRPAPVVEAGAAPSVELPGHPLLVTGLRPPGLGGYGDTLEAAALRTRLTEILAAKAQLHPDLVVVSGLGLGAEQEGAAAALDAGVPLVVVLAFPGQEEVWAADSRRRFAELLARAGTTVALGDRRPTSRQAAGAALARRDDWLARRVVEAVVVWDGRDAAVGRTARSLRDHLGEEQVWVVDV